MKIQVLLKVVYDFMSETKLKEFNNFINETLDCEKLYNDKYIVFKTKEDDQEMTLYAKDENENKFNLPEEIIERIIHPSDEWEGTPTLIIKHENNEYDIDCVHVDEM